MGTVETPTFSADFALKLGKIFTVWAERHPTPDESVMEFVGQEPDGTMRKTACTPREFAQAISKKTPFGLRQIEFYHQISINLGDPTGERVIRDLEKKL